jgi:outer membrane protein assembly factor BamA
VRVGYSTELGTGGIRYDYDSLRTDNRTRFQLAAKVSALDVVHFYGFGNETSAEGDQDFHDVRQTQYVFAPSYRLDMSAIDVSVGPVVKYADTRLSDTTLVGQERPYGSLGFGQAGVRVALALDRRNHKTAPSRGFLVAAEGTVYPPMWSVTDLFGQVHGFATAYLAAPLPLAPVLALRAGGARVFGVYPFHEAATIGGPDSVRGFRQQRYSGDASLYGNAELRLTLYDHEGSLPVRFGVFGLGDTGRVFLADETSDRWHTAFGAGLWMTVLNPAYTASVSFARGEGETWLYFQAGFSF